METRDKRAMDLALYAGRILLQSGAEIARVEETIRRIAGHYGIREINLYVLSTGIFLTAENEREQLYGKVECIPLDVVRLDKVDAVNRLSREIVSGKWHMEQAREQLRQIDAMPTKSPLTMTLASGLGAGAFCYLIGGSVPDSLLSGVVGCILNLMLILLAKRKKRTSKLLSNMGCAALVTGISLALWSLGLGQQYSKICVGAIMPLLPGVSFVNAIRDIANTDYLSGTSRLIDTVLVTFGIALGVGLAFLLFHQLGGGELL